MVRIIKLLFIIFYCTWVLGSCKKEYSNETPVQIAQGTLSGDTALWQPGGKLLNITGYTSDTKDSALVIWIYLPYGAVTTGPYTTVIVPPAKNEAFFTFFKNASANGGGDPMYESSAALQSYTQTNITVNVTSYNTSTNLLTGTFSGTAEIMANGTGTGKIVSITQGSFTVTFRE